MIVALQVELKITKGNKTMKRIAIKYKPIINIFITLAESIITGIFLSLIADKIKDGYSFIESIQEINDSDTYILLFLLCLFLHIYIECYVSTYNKKYNKKTKEELINSILKEACDSFVYPHNNYNIRANIAVCNYKEMKRKIVYYYNMTTSPEKYSEYGIYFGVAGLAISRRIPIAQALSDNHIDTYDVNTKDFVEPRLKCVLAAPIFLNRDDKKVVGVLSFDSMDCIETMRFDTDKSKEIAQSWANIFSNIVDESDY